jgi:hypothetical protein
MTARFSRPFELSAVAAMHPQGRMAFRLAEIMATRIFSLFVVAPSFD